MNETEVLREHYAVSIDMHPDDQDTDPIEDILAQISTILHEAEEKGIIKKHHQDYMFSERVDHEYNE